VSEIKLGSVVKLKSGSAAMTVTDLDADNGIVTVMHFDDAMNDTTYEIHKDALIEVKDDEARTAWQTGADRLEKRLDTKASVTGR
jgi:uncharacterized protein YodC (DUF2158 family)